MGEGLLAAIITGVLTLVGVIVNSKYQHSQTMAEFQKQSELSDARIEAKIEKHQAVTDTKIEELTRETRKHNAFAERVPVLEEQMRVANHRIEDLERKVS